MRGLFYPVLALIAILVIGILWLIARPPSWWLQVSATVSSITGKSPDVKSAPSQTSLEKPNPFETKKTAHLGRPDSRVEVTESAPASAFPKPKDIKYPFPVAQEIITGAARSAILARYGPPSAMVTGADVGQLRERFIYVDKPDGRKTVIVLINGNVISVETGAQ